MGETNLLKSLNKKNSIILISILIIICLVFYSLFAYLEFFTEEKTSLEDEAIEYDLDDRISPLTNQGLILDINRIRHRGLLDNIKLSIETSGLTNSSDKSPEDLALFFTEFM